MRYAIISDIHANLQALEAVLADISVQNIDSVVCLGDAVGYGTQPVEVLKIVQETVHVMLMGNHDAAVADLMDTSDFSDGALLSIASTKPLLDDSTVSYIESLPYGYTTPEFACAHANLANPENFEYVQTVEDAGLSFKARTERLLFVGHTHAPAVFLMDPEGSCSKLSADGFIVLHSCRYLINPGSVGMPRTKDLRATYCIYDTVENRVSFHRVSYDVQAFRKMIEKDAKSSEQIAYVLNLLDSHMLPARKTSTDVSSPAVRKIREAAMAARKAKKGTKPSGKSAGGKSMFLDDTALMSIQSASSRPKRKTVKSDPVKTRMSGRWLVVVAFLVVAGLVLGTFAYKKLHSEALPDQPQTLPPGLELISSTAPDSLAPANEAEKQHVTTNRVPARFENLLLIHRWSFNDCLTDSEGHSDAKIIEGGLNDVHLGTNQVVITGGARDKSDYVSLGSGLLAGKTTPVTIEMWVTQISTKKSGRIFDFGNGEKNSLMMTWTIGQDLNKDKVEWQDCDGSASVDNSNKPYTPGKEYHVVMIVEPKAGAGKKTLVTWYSAPSGNVEMGAAKGKLATSSVLAKLVDAQDNLGRSFYDGDETANAAYNEVRIWSGAASWTVVEMLHKLGPDTVFK